MKFRIALAAAATIALAACGRSDDASTQAKADSVEVPADEAMAGVAEAPVADANANADTMAAETGEETAKEAPKTEDQKIQEAGDKAAETAAAAADAMTEAPKN